MRSRVVVLIVAGLVLGACTNNGPSAIESQVPSTNADGTPAISWTAEKDGVQSGTLVVPIDYSQPDTGNITLFMVRHLATDPSKRIGTLLINPGGPGVGGSDYAAAADQLYSPTLLSHFDILGWDPRGTGQSTPAIDCIDDYDRFYASPDITPDDDAERQQIVDLAEEFQNGCVTKTGDVLPFVGTNNSARDMDAIRRALGEATITYFGFSYGSELGATWATLFPDTVRAAVLDGAANPNASFTDGALAQTTGFEDALTRFLADCSADDTCAFHSNGDAEGAFDALMTSLDERPMPSERGRPDVNLTVAVQASAVAMYDEQLWPTLAEALADARDGDGDGLLALFDQYYMRGRDGTYPNDNEAFQSISCMDTEERLTVAEEDALASTFRDAAPRLSPGTTGSYFCTFYPAATDPRAAITGKGAGPILVVGTTGDPATPLSDTEVMATTLEQGVLLVVVGNQHTGYRVNQCSYDAIDGYLIDLTVPETGTRCG